MFTLNEVSIAGVVKKDPEKKVTQSGRAKSTLIVETVEDSSNNKTGSNFKRLFHRVILLGKLAENCQLLREGCNVFVKGKISYRSWVDEKNTKRYVTEILAKEVKVVQLNNGESAKE